jgi:Protein of unknown function (DUF3828)
MKKTTFFCLILTSFLACKEAPKNTSTTTPTDKVAEVPTDKGGAQNDADLIAITDVVHNFYKWYPTTVDNLEYVDSKGKTSKLDNTKLAAYHDKLMKSGFISKAYIDNDVAYLKKYEAEWTKNKENNNDGPLSGLDYDRVFCGQDWEPKDYTTGTLKVDGLGTNQAKTTVGASHLELVKENGKWLISKITCE